MAVRSKQPANPARPRKASLPPKVKLAYGGAAAVTILATAAIGVYVLKTPDAVPTGPAASFAGAVVLNASGAELASWNQTSSYCRQTSWTVPDGAVTTDPAGDAQLDTTGKPGSCVAIASPHAYTSGVVEADIYFPALPGKPGTIANWTAFWLANQAKWTADGEIHAVESEPLTGVNAVSYRWGARSKPRHMSTDGLAADGKIPVTAPNLTPGFHVVDVVFAKGFFAVYYDGHEYASARSSVITGAPLNILLTSAVTPNTSAVRKGIGGKPKNSDSSPATVEIKYLNVWAYSPPA
jgi:hypothetical protein